MRINTTGEIKKGFHVLGSAEMPMYLLDGPKPVIFDTGLACLGRIYEHEILETLHGRPPAYLLITHSHFDHVGSAGYLKRIWPDMKIAASARVGEIISRPRAVELIKTLNIEAAKVARTWTTLELPDDGFLPFELDIILEPDQMFDLGDGRMIQAIPTPGHTWDFMSYWAPRERILIASESAGCEDPSGEIVSEFLVDYDVYRESINRLTELDVDVLCQGHHFVYTGPEANKRIRAALKQSEKYLAMVERFLTDEHGDVGQAAERVKASEWDPKPEPKQALAAYMLNTNARVKTIRERMRKK